MVMVPVAVVQVGCAVTVAVGAAGAGGTALTLAEVPMEIQPGAFCTVTLYTFCVSPVNTGLAWKGPPMLYNNPAPSGAETVMVPVGLVQVGCVTVTVGAGGVGGKAFTVSTVAAETQPAAFCTVTLYTPGVKPVNTGLAW